jgi:hypothetical protein
LGSSGISVGEFGGSIHWRAAPALGFKRFVGASDLA